jgi:hypothetical protein
VGHLTKGRIAYNLAFGIALTITVSFVSSKSGRTLKAAAIGAFAWGALGLIGSGEPRRYTVPPLPSDRVPPRVSIVSALTPEFAITAAVVAGVGVLTAVTSTHRTKGEALVLGFPVGSAVGQALQLFEWKRIAREERGTLWIGKPSLVTRRTARLRGVLAVTEPVHVPPT